MKKYLLFVLFFALAIICKSQNYAVQSIPDSLKEGAVAVVRQSVKTVTQKDDRNGTYKHILAVTILNEKGKENAAFYTHEDDFETLKSFSGEVFDANGKSVKKFKKSDLKYIQFSQSYELAINSKIVYMDYFNPVYPFTVRYEYEVKMQNGILMYPIFYPITNYDVAVENAEYILQVPDIKNVRYKKLQTSAEPKITENTMTWQIKNLKAIDEERFAPDDEEFPVIFLSPQNFCVETACGSMQNWETYGQWVQNLRSNRNILPEKTKETVNELLKNMTDKHEKIRILYEFMQKNTHYVSIQLGVGGWQPMKAEEVARTGFGDCKALSNYMCALLEAAQIPSLYTVISTNRKRFFPDFPSFGQANHVIVSVPLETDTIYLECTSQFAPFGYISKLAGHDALAVGQEKSFLFTIPKYFPKENATENRAEITLNSDGLAKIKVHTTLKNQDFESLYYTLKTADEKVQKEKIGGILQAHKPQISNLQKEEKLNSIPQLVLRFDASCEDYASLSGARMLVKINPFRVSLRNLLTGNKRHFDIDMQNSHYQCDTVRIAVPDGFILENLPKPTEIDTKYGYLKTQISENENIITYIQTFELKTGRFPAADFDEMKKAYTRLETLQSGEVVFKKK